jgi:hypothetical protein
MRHHIGMDGKKKKKADSPYLINIHSNAIRKRCRESALMLFGGRRVSYRGLSSEFRFISSKAVSMIFCTIALGVFT